MHPFHALSFFSLKLSTLFIKEVSFGSTLFIKNVGNYFENHPGPKSFLRSSEE